MGRNTSVAIGDHFEAFIDNNIATGRYKNASEVIRAGLRLLEEQEMKFLTLKKEISKGVDSGTASDFDPQKHLAALKAGRKKNA